MDIVLVVATAILQPFQLMPSHMNFEQFEVSSMEECRQVAEHRREVARQAGGEFIQFSAYCIKGDRLEEVVFDEKSL